jgi:UDP:flavonoid glycosyltransferase YjiC (YdhE family)
VSELLPDCLEVAKTFQPDLILYDFFSLEGFFVGKMLGIPYWCSIPAMLGPFTHQAYLSQKLNDPKNQEALKAIEERYGISISEPDIEMISDGLHLPGQTNLLWSYPSLTPKDYLLHRAPKLYEFIGSAKADDVRQKKERARPLVYFSFGTVVMDNIWNQQAELVLALKAFIGEFARVTKDKSIDVVFVSQGKRVLEAYPENWQVFDSVDQMDMLSQASVFVTHAGGNSFHEAVLQRVPMIAIPFFGDQILISRQIEALGIGVNLVQDSDIDTKKSKQFLTQELAHRLEDAVNRILASDTCAKSYEKLSLDHVSLEALLRRALSL